MSKLFCAVAVTTAGVAGSASAHVVLDSIDLFFGFGTGMNVDSAVMGFGMIADQNPNNPANRLFAVDQVMIGAGDVGTTWVASGDTAAAIKAHFADDDLVDGLGFFAYESEVSGRVMEGDWGDSLDIDLVGRLMDEMHVTLLMWQPVPGNLPNTTDLLFRVRYEFVAIPAPGGVVALGAAGLLGVRRRR